MARVDKSLIIKHVLDSPSTKIKVFVKPSRFGKTTAIRQLRDFLSLDSEDTTFESKAIGSADEGRYLAFRNQYPVIYVSFVELDHRSLDAMIYAFKSAVCYAYHDHCSRLWPLMSEEERRQYKDTYMKRQKDAADSLKLLVQLLSKYCQRKPFILIDEYDTPCYITWFYSQSLYQQWLEFINSAFTAALGDTDAYEQAVMTGVFKFSRVLDGLPSVQWCTIDAPAFSQFFGFTEAEARDVVGADRWCNGIKDWYGGYRMGDTDMYYPLALSNYRREFDVFSFNSDSRCLQQAPKYPNFWYGMFGSSRRVELKNPRPEIKAAVKALVEHFDSGSDTPAVTTAPFDDFPGDCTVEDITLSCFLYTCWANAYLTWQPVDNDLYGLKIPNLQTRRFFVERLDEWRRDSS